MDIREILHYVDHTQLKAFATWDDMEKLCDESIRYETASVCIPPAYVKNVYDTYGKDINICTVIGFPLGYETAETKIKETECAINDGASEIDMVINIGALKSGRLDLVKDEISRIRQAADKKILKVIIETCYLTDEEKIAMCRTVTECNADFIKTSTGFGTEGAVLSDIALFKKYIGSSVKIKAAGGIRTREFMEQLIEAGASRLGCSAAVSLAEDEDSRINKKQ